MIKKTSKRFARQGLLLTTALTLLSLIVMQVCFLDELLYPVVVSAVFSLIFTFAEAIVWSRVAERNNESLPTFYTAVSGFRLLLALFTLLVYYLVMGSDAMREFFIVFFAYYIVMLAHHSVFFSHITKRL